VGEEPSPVPRRRRGRRIAVAVLAAVIVAVAVLTAHLFVWPSLPPLPAKSDVIVQLGGPGNRRQTALNLARQGQAPLLAIAVSNAEINTSWCYNGELRGVKVLCFHPLPFTTRGEGRYVAQLAAKYGWHSVVLVTTPDQATRAILRVRRCYGGRIYVAEAKLHWFQWPIQIAYQWAATIKAYTLERSC
jgi:uncharacterized SAM-binding protein YcdF (DUF218 family)